MTAVVALSHGTALWYLTRAIGLVSLVLLSATVVLGIVSSLGWTAHRWPRFVSQAMHRNLSLFCIALIGIHIVSTVADGFVPIGYVDAFIPFLTPYRPLWIGLGALAFDMLLAVAITSGLRRHIGVRSWRGVHYLAYACWPIAVLHGLGSGTDARLTLTLLLEILCIAAVVAAVVWRVVAARGMPGAWRLAVVGATMAVVMGIAVFAVAGPLRSGWSRRAGTSATVLAQIAAKFAPAAARTTGGTSATTTVPSTVPSTTGAVPAAPFTANVSGSIQTSNPNSAGDVAVRLTMQVQGTNAPLVVQLSGPAVNGGVSMTSSTVSFGDERGSVTGLDGSTIQATVHGPSGGLKLVAQLTIDQNNGSVSGSLTGSSK